MIRFDWRRGETEVAHVSHTWKLTRTDIAGLIIAAIAPTDYVDLERKRTKAELEAAVREQLAVHADKRHWWMDEYAEEYPGEPTADEVEAWGMEQAARL